MRLVFVLLAGAGLVLSTAPAQACPMCANALQSEGAGNLAQAFQYSILFMLSMPYLLLGAFGLLCYRLVRKAQAQQSLGTACEPRSAPRESIEPVPIAR